MIVIRYDDNEAHIVPDSEQARIIRDPYNYPVPATMLTSAVANFHSKEWHWKWAVEWTKARLRSTV